MKKISAILLGFLLVVIVACFLALPTMWLWNYLMPTIFGLIKINFWQALCVNIFSAILFKGSLKQI